MDAKEKALELFNNHLDASYSILSDTGDGNEVVRLAKQSALITANTIINDYKYVEMCGGISSDVAELRIKYWNNVLNHITDL